MISTVMPAIRFVGLVFAFAVALAGLCLVAFFAFIAVGMALFMAFSGPAEAQVRPNVVVMLTDDQRFDMLGVVQRAQGAAGRFPWMRSATPNLDRLAATAARFTDAFTTTALCAPSRASMLSGRYAHSHGIRHNATPLPASLPTYASVLRERGWRTGYFGKWHMGNQRERPGFDVHASYVNQGVYFNGPFLVNGVSRPTTGWVEDVTTDFALDFIRRNAGRPFVAVVGFKSPHGPFQPPPRHATRFTGAQLGTPANARDFAIHDDTPFYVQPPNRDVEDYSETIVGVDDNVGRITAELARLGISQRTIVVFASDNGFHWGEHGIPENGNGGNKREAYEESMRVPLIIRDPRINRNGPVKPTALNIDLAPTILELAGAPRPPGMQGRSLVPTLRTGAAVRTDGFLYEYFPAGPTDTVPLHTAWRQGGWKLIDYPGFGQMLFNLNVDRLERTNLVGDPAAAADLQRMRAALAAGKRATGYRP